MTVLYLEPIGGTLEILADLFAKHAERVPVLGRAAAAIGQGLTGMFSRTSIGRKISASTGRTFPLGYFMVAAKPE